MNLARIQLEQQPPRVPIRLSLLQTRYPIEQPTHLPLRSHAAREGQCALYRRYQYRLGVSRREEGLSRRLYYRLNVLTIQVPSLTDRKEDIEPLARYFCESACRGYELNLLTLAPTAIQALEETEWPGNVRQLGHRIETAVIRASMEGATQVQRHHILPEEAQSAEKAGGALTFQEATRRFQKKYLQESLEAAQWNISETSRRLDLTRTHIRTLINAFEISRAEKK